jgi:hypothetical protein
MSFSKNHWLIIFWVFFLRYNRRRKNIYANIGSNKATFMIKKMMHLFVFAGVMSAYCEQKPPMPVQVYMFNRITVESDGGNTNNLSWQKKYRLPTDKEKRAYLYSSYIGSFAREGGEDNVITLWDIGRLCKWLIRDSPNENISYIVGFVDEKAKEYKKDQTEFFTKKNEMEQIITQPMLALSGLGADAMPYYLKFLKSDNEILHQAACQGVSELFKNKDISEETKKAWIREFIDLVWYPDAPCRKQLVSELLSLDSGGYAPMDIKDWVSICCAETDIEVFEKVYALHPEEFREWQKKKGGFRSLIRGTETGSVP